MGTAVLATTLDNSTRTAKMWALLCTLVFLPVVASQLINKDIQCPKGQYIVKLSSTYNRKSKDRTWDGECGGSGASVNCHATEWMNEAKQDGFDMCHWESVVTGFRSRYNPKLKDREYQFTCCGVAPKSLTKCRTTSRLNGLRGKVNFKVNGKWAPQGGVTIYNNKKKDRQWRMYICLIGK